MLEHHQTDYITDEKFNRELQELLKLRLEQGHPAGEFIIFDDPVQRVMPDGKLAVHFINPDIKTWYQETLNKRLMDKTTISIHQCNVDKDITLKILQYKDVNYERDGTGRD